MLQTINPLRFSDQNDYPLFLGDTVTVTKGKNKGNATYVFVFCIPQHRFGFLHKMIFDKIVENNNMGLYDKNIMPEPFVIDIPNLDFYWTPKSKTEILKMK